MPSSSYAVVLETVKKYNEKFGMMLLVKVLAGSKETRIQQWHLDDYEHYGIFSDMTLDMVSAMFEALLMEDFLFKTEGKYPCLGITEYGGAALYKNIYITQNLVDLNGYVMQKIGNKAKKPVSIKNSGKKALKGQTYQETLILYQRVKECERNII